MNALGRLTLAVTLALAAAPVSAQAPTNGTPIVNNTFASEVEGWTTFAMSGGGTAKVSATQDSKLIREGARGALLFGYSITKGELAVAILPTPGGKLAGAKSIRFWVKSDADTTLAVGMQEEGGGRYLAPIAVQADKWQQVEIPMSDFVLSTSKDDPKDPDGKLDVEQVQGIGVLDLGQMFAQMEGQLQAALFPLKTGEHKLLLSEFVVSAKTAPASLVTAPLATTLDTFQHPQVSWVAIGGAKLSVVDGGPVGAPSLSVIYHTGPTSGGGAMKSLPQGVFSRAKAIEFDAVSSKPTKLFVQLEQPNGGKFNTMVDLDGGAAKQHFSLTLANLSPAQDSAPDAKLDLDRLNSLILGDLSGVLGGPEQDNRLYIGNLKVVK